MNKYRSLILIILCALSFAAQGKKINSCPLPGYKLV